MALSACGRIDVDEFHRNLLWFSACLQNCILFNIETTLDWKIICMRELLVFTRPVSQILSFKIVVKGSSIDAKEHMDISRLGFRVIPAVAKANLSCNAIPATHPFAQKSKPLEMILPLPDMSSSIWLSGIYPLPSSRSARQTSSRIYPDPAQKDITIRH